MSREALVFAQERYGLTRLRMDLLRIYGTVVRSQSPQPSVLDPQGLAG
jgi:hypothetical protein